MSSLTLGFFARMRKKVTSSQGETTLGFKVPRDKSPKRLDLDKDIQKSPTLITSVSLE